MATSDARRLLRHGRHATYLRVHATYVRVHATYVLVHATYVLVHATYVLVHATYLLVHATYVLVHATYLLVHATYLLVHATYVLVPPEENVRGFASITLCAPCLFLGQKRHKGSFVRRLDEEEGTSFVKEEGTSFVTMTLNSFFAAISSWFSFVVFCFPSS